MSIVRIVHLYFSEDYLEEFEIAFKKYKPELLQQDGCFDVHLYRVLGTEGEMATLSIWRDEACLDRYREGAVFRSMWGRIKPNFIKKPIAKSLEAIH